MNFEAVLHYKHQNQARDEKKKLRHASGASITSANTEGSNSESDAESAENSPIPSPVQKKVTEVPFCPICVERLVLYCLDSGKCYGREQTTMHPWLVEAVCICMYIFVYTQSLQQK